MAAITLNILAERQQHDRSASSCGPPGSTSRSRTSGARRRARSTSQKYPAHLTPMLEEEGLPRGTLGRAARSWRTSATSTASTQFYPTDPGERAMVDNAMFYLIGTFYPLLTRADVSGARLPPVPGRGRDVERRRRHEGEGAAGRRGRARRAARGVFRAFFLDGRPFIGGDSPSIADIRLAATLEFLHAIDYDFPAWAEEYMARDGVDARRRATRSRRPTCAAAIASVRP